MEDDRLCRELLVTLDRYYTRPKFHHKSSRKVIPWAHCPGSLPYVSDTFHPPNQENPETLHRFKGNKIFGLKEVYSHTPKTDALGELQRTEP